MQKLTVIDVDYNKRAFPQNEAYDVILNTVWNENNDTRPWATKKRDLLWIHGASEIQYIWATTVGILQVQNKKGDSFWIRDQIYTTIHISRFSNIFCYFFPYVLWLTWGYEIKIYVRSKMQLCFK